MLTAEEVFQLREGVDHPHGVQKHAYGREDAGRKVAKICIWQQPGDDVTGVTARIHKVAGTMEQVRGAWSRSGGHGADQMGMEVRGAWCRSEKLKYVRRSWRRSGDHRDGEEHRACDNGS